MDPLKSYHHGDLRAELLKAARAKLDANGYETLSLRELARDLGVARSAPYSHFVNREALLMALIAQGARDLLIGFEAAQKLPLSAEEKLKAACRVHLNFADAQPEMYRLLLMAPVDADAAAMVNPQQTLAIFEGLIADVMQNGDRFVVLDTAVACLATLHGFCMLRFHRRLLPGIDPVASAESVVAATVRLAQTAPV